MRLAEDGAPAVLLGECGVAALLAAGVVPAGKQLSALRAAAAGPSSPRLTVLYLRTKNQQMKGVRVMNASTLDQADEEALGHEVADDAIEAAADIEWGPPHFSVMFSGPGVPGMCC